MQVDVLQGRRGVRLLVIACGVRVCRLRCSVAVYAVAAATSIAVARVAVGLVAHQHIAQFNFTTRTSGQGLRGAGAGAGIGFGRHVFEHLQAALQCCHATRNGAGNIGQAAYGRNQHQHSRNKRGKRTHGNGTFCALHGLRLPQGN